MALLKANPVSLLKPITRYTWNYLNDNNIYQI